MVKANGFNPESLITVIIVIIETNMAMMNHTIKRLYSFHVMDLINSTIHAEETGGIKSEIALGETRTPNLFLRTDLLYPIELRRLS